MKMNLWILVVLSCAVLMACTTTKKPGQPASGMEGYIYKLSGNQMPGPGRKPGKSRGVSRPVWIYKATTAQQARGQMPLFTQINSQLVAQTQSDTTGHYHVSLPAGKYSVFIKEANGFFAAEADGEGHLNPVVITAGQILKKDFTITLQAAF